MTLVDLTVLLDQLATAYAGRDWAETSRIWDEWVRRKGLSLAAARVRVLLLAGRGDPAAGQHWGEHMQQLVRLSTHVEGAAHPEQLLVLQTLEDWQHAEPWAVFLALMTARGDAPADTPFDGWVGLIGTEWWLHRHPDDPVVLKTLAELYAGQMIHTLANAFDLVADALGGAETPDLPLRGYPGWNEHFAAAPPADPIVAAQVRAYLEKRRT